MGKCKLECTQNWTLLFGLKVSNVGVLIAEELNQVLEKTTRLSYLELWDGI